MLTYIAATAILFLAITLAVVRAKNKDNPHAFGMSLWLRSVFVAIIFALSWVAFRLSEQPELVNPMREMAIVWTFLLAVFYLVAAAFESISARRDERDRLRSSL